MGKLRLRETYIRDGEALPNSGSRSYPLNIVDPIPDLYFKFTATNGHYGNIRNYMFDVVEEIEVIDGSDVLFSMKPREILALDAYHYKESLHWGIDEIADHDQECVFKIPFGLGRYDPTIGLDPTKFKNPQVRFSWDLENVTAVGNTGFVDDSLLVDIVATVAEKYPVRPSGFLMHKHITEWETMLTGVHRVEMPVDYPHRTVFMSVKEKITENKTCPWSILTDAKYNVDQEKYVPFNWHTDDWSLWLKEFYGMWHQGMEFVMSGGTGAWRNLFLEDNKALALTSKGQDKFPWWSQGTGCQVYISGGAAITTFNVHVKMDGSLPFSTWAYPFGDPKDMEEWLQVLDIGKIYFEITQARADELARVALTQYRTY